MHQVHKTPISCNLNIISSHMIVLITAISLISSTQAQYFITADDSYCLSIGCKTDTNNEQLFWVNVSSSSNCINFVFEEPFNHETDTVFKGKLYTGSSYHYQRTARMYAQDADVNIKDGIIEDGSDEFELDFTTKTLANSINCTLGMSVNDSTFILDDSRSIDGNSARFDCSDSGAVTAINIVYQTDLHYVIVDENDVRTLSEGNLLGVMDVLDNILIKFDVIINSWPLSPPSNWRNIIRIGGNAPPYKRFPLISLHASQLLHFAFTYVQSDSISKNVPGLDLNTLYHVIYYHTQDHLTITANDIIKANSSTASHPILFDQDIHLSLADFLPANVTLSNLYISTSNAHTPSAFNYLCDADNRLYVTNGAWIFNISECNVRSTDDTSIHSALWLGGYDTYSMNWTNYKVEVSFAIHTGENIYFLFRTQSATSITDRDGYFLETKISTNQTRFGKYKNSGKTIIASASFIWEYDMIYTMRIQILGSEFNFYHDDQFVFSATDATYESGSVGLKTYRASATFYSLRIVFESDNDLLYSSNPTSAPTSAPILAPTLAPTSFPTLAPSLAPTLAPSSDPTSAPTIDPTSAPSNNPTQNPTIAPSASPSIAPTQAPTLSPSAAPTISPTTCYENSNDTDDDGWELSINDRIATLQFSHEITNDDKIMNIVNDFVFYGKELLFPNQSQSEQQVICSGTISCHGSTMSFMDDMQLCNVLCNGSYACASRLIHIDACQKSEIICNGDHSCDRMIIEINSVSNDELQVKCGSSTSCNNMEINVYGNAVTETDCVGLNACDSLTITIDPDNYKNNKLQMFSYSQNVVFSNGFGYKDINSSYPFIECNTLSTYIKWNESMTTDAQVEPLILNEYQDAKFPCDSVTINCFQANDSESVSSCDMRYNIEAGSFSVQYESVLAPCYWVEVDDIIDILCVGDCESSPTEAPTNAPTESPTEETQNPTNDPTIEPTYDPTQDPTNNPTIDPTIDPTNDPTIDPTVDPTIDPTQFPTIDPTIDPTNNPTSNPTNSPTISPSVAPSKTPSTPPTNAPTHNPSIAPSVAPTATPSNTPSHPPSAAPSYSPSRSPSFSPTNAPTNAPTFGPSNAPTRFPTADVDDKERGYDYFVDIEYGVHNLSADNKQYIVAHTKKVVNEIEEMLESNYFDEEVLKYNAFWLDINQVNGVDFKYGNKKLSQYDLDILNLEGIPMVLNTRIETKEQLTGFIITKSNGDTFRKNAELNLQTYFNNTALYFNVLYENELMANAKFTTQPPKEEEDKTALALSIAIVSIGSIISVCALIFNKMEDTTVDNAAFFAPLLISLNLYDFISDINLSYTMMEKVDFSKQIMYEFIFWLAIASVVFILLPFASNLLYAMRITKQKAIQSNPDASAYFSNMLAQFILMCVFCAGTYPVIGLTSSRIFGLQIFNAGLLSHELHELSKIKIRSTIYLENGPQLVIQILYSLLQRDLETATILAFVASSLSVIASIIIYQAQKDVSDEISKYYITLYTKQIIDADEKESITRYRGLKEALGNSLSALFDVSNKTIEIGRVTLNDHGCTIHIQHSVFKQQLEEYSQKHGSDGYTINKKIYTQKLFENHRSKINKSLVKHFHLDTAEKQFIVRYHLTKLSADSSTTTIAFHHNIEEVVSSDDDRDDMTQMRHTAAAMTAGEIQLAEIHATNTQEKSSLNEKDKQMIEAFSRLQQQQMNMFQRFMQAQEYNEEEKKSEIVPNELVKKTEIVYKD